MATRTLTINWDIKNPKYVGPAVTAFKNIKTVEKATKTLNRRNLTSIVSAFYEDTLIYERPVEVKDETIETVVDETTETDDSEVKEELRKGEENRIIENIENIE